MVCQVEKLNMCLFSLRLQSYYKSFEDDKLLTTKMLGDVSTDPILSLGKHGGARETLEEYHYDFIQISIEREYKRIYFNHRSRQFPYRRHLVDFLRNTCNERGFSHSCLHLATYFLDIYMDYHQINIRRLTLVAIAGLLMAAKIEETSRRVPKLNDLMPVRNDEVKKHFRDIECAMLIFFRWDLNIPTAAHHVPYYMQVMLTEEELNRPGSPNNILDDMCNDLEEYLDILLYDVHLMQGFSPSRVAAALIAACRIRHGYSTWNPELTKISNLTPTDFQDILERIL